jgi:cytoskeletal protein RodZ
MKKIVVILMVVCFSLAFIAVTPKPAFAYMDTSQLILPVTVGMAAFVGLVLFIVHQCGGFDNDKNAITSEQQAQKDKEKSKAQLDEKNQLKTISASAITATAETTSVSANTDAASDTLEKKLKDLKALHDSKDITDEEYKQMKEKLLNDIK